MKIVNEFNEKFKGDEKFARQVSKTYETIIIELANKFKAKEHMKKMIERNIVLYHLGFALIDNGKLVKII